MSVLQKAIENGEFAVTIFRIDLALPVLLAAAGPVDQAFGTFGNGADAASGAQYAVAAHVAVFVEHTHALYHISI